MIFKVTFYIICITCIFKSGIVIITGNASINICVLQKWKKMEVCKGIDWLIWKWTICDKSPMCGGARLLFSSFCLADCRSMQSHWRPPDFTHKEIWLPVYLSGKQDPQHTTKTPFLLLSEGLHSISQPFVLHFFLTYLVWRPEMLQ